MGLLRLRGFVVLLAVVTVVAAGTLPVSAQRIRPTKTRAARSEAKAKTATGTRPRAKTPRTGKDANRNALGRKQNRNAFRRNARSLGRVRSARKGLAKRSARALRRFRIDEGHNTNVFHQSSRLAVHTVVRKGQKPRIVVATPAGNSGIGVWFDNVSGGAGELRLESNIHEIDHDGIPGVSFEVSGPSKLRIRRVILDSVRGLRAEGHGNYDERTAEVSAALAALKKAPRTKGVRQLEQRLREWVKPSAARGADGSLVLRRTTPAGVRYRLELVPAAGTELQGKGQRTTLRGKGRTRFEIRAFIERAPLTPLKRVLGPRAKRDQNRNLGFLSYKDAFLAGSWQYLSYFGRDTLITASLISKDATPESLASAVGSVLDRVSRRGEVAHEEHIGDQAVIERITKFAKRVAAGKAKVTPRSLAALEKPLYDYKMIDGEYLLPQVVDAYLRADGPKRAGKTLSDSRIDALARVASRVAKQTRGFHRKPTAGNLLKLRRGMKVGNWRDSLIGLGNGDVPLDVNAYLIPAALETFARMMDRPGFPKAKFLRALARHDARAARLFRSGRAVSSRARKWRRSVEAFQVALNGKEARSRLESYLMSLPVEQRNALSKRKLWSGVTVGDAVLGGESAPELDRVSFPALSLDDKGKPIPIQNSDEAFDLFYGEPSKQELLQSVTRMFQPFPVGLATPVGLVVANPGYSDRPGDAAMFARDKYHGAVIWSWPQSMVLQGLDRQAERFKGDTEVQKVVGRAKKQLNRALKKAGGFGASELWTWTAARGGIRAEAFGKSDTHTDESNALQLWSNTR